jgi:hypothetical protein
MVTVITEQDRDDIIRASEELAAGTSMSEPLDRDGYTVIQRENIPDMVDSPVALWVAITRLMGQELVQLSEEKVSRPSRKRLERLNLKPVVTVIALRKKKYVGRPTQETGTGRHLHYRHLVRGHWKTVNTLDGPRRCYVSHYFRGPDDAPLYVSDKVNALLR